MERQGEKIVENSQQNVANSYIITAGMLPNDGSTAD